MVLKHQLLRATLSLGLTLSLLTRLGAAQSTPSAAATSHLPELVAVYEVVQTRQARTSVTELVLVRTTDRIEYRYPERGVIDVWRRDAENRVRHDEIFTPEQRVIHYEAGDLAAIHATPVWTGLATLAVPVPSAQSLTSAPRHGRGDLACTQHEANGTALRYCWSAAWGLPVRARFVSRAPNGTQDRRELRLKSVSGCASSPSSGPPVAQSACAASSFDGFLELDFSDLGDRENDPWVRQFLGHARRH